MRAFALWLLLALPATAQEGFVSDWGEVFSRNAARVETVIPGQRRLELPGPVIVTERRGKVTAVDQSGGTAALCRLDILLTIAAFSGLCPDMLGAEELDRLEQSLWMTGVFAARNAIPEIPQAEVGDRLRALIVAKATPLATAICPIEGGKHHDFLMIARDMTRPAALRLLEQDLRRPRLPVMNPCL
ncbi:hypothetical protein SAMN05421688_2241 [Poseidonocella pacifica]|uniref:Uncharacterized protein n=1 Tax=Poseidonocella pacifica TaxID=871651 RepID=A0A1I0XIH4_9RHOB|nr:hypothetical protein [Poseidonocella pacifica]SFB00028.1 hypothetical protein SAMN05421688_2241 [Poseidonocella pacifica]